jgi:hypothetical protein
MSKAEILAELPKLKAEERTQVFERLCELQERDLLEGQGPTPEGQRLLDRALAEFERDGQRGRTLARRVAPPSVVAPAVTWRDQCMASQSQGH